MAQIYSFSPFGYEGSLVTIETDLRRGIPATDIVGLADGAVKESRERMQAAIRNQGLEYPSERVLISLSPADLKKEGAGFDLPVAMGVLNAKDEENNSEKRMIDKPCLIMGELELSGQVRPVKAIHAAASTAKASGIEYMICPKLNEEEAMSVDGMKVLGVETLGDAYSLSKNIENFKSNSNKKETELAFKSVFNEPAIEELKQKEKEGQFKYFDNDGLRALEIAIAGKHNLNLVGAPGCGKTMMIQDIMPALTPNLTSNEALSTTRIWSLAGLIRPSEPIINIPPFRMPHQTASIEGICGGGPNCRPGEISLAQNGTLFLDEAAEFRSSVLQMLRVPLENGNITLSRAGRTTVYPAKFQLAMANNPCPCGNCGSSSKICLCSSKSIDQYYKKFSAPLLDRVDINAFIDIERAGKQTEKITVDEMKKHIETALEIQRQNGNYNSRLSAPEIADLCKMDNNTRDVFDSIAVNSNFSPRKYAAAQKVALTIANMEGRTHINEEDIKEACSFVTPVYDFTNNNSDILKTSVYHKSEDIPEIKEKENQKEFLENANKTFEESAVNALENSKEIKRILLDEKITKDLTESQIEAVTKSAMDMAESFRAQNQKINTVSEELSEKDKKIHQMFDDMFNDENHNPEHYSPQDYVNHTVMSAGYSSTKDGLQWRKEAVDHAVNSGGSMWLSTDERVEQLVKYGIMNKADCERKHDKIDTIYGQLMHSYLSQTTDLNERNNSRNGNKR